MIELQLTLVSAAAVAECLTRRSTPANAPAAHRLWLVVLASPLLWLAGAWLFAPAVLIGLRPGVLPDVALAFEEGRSTIVWLYLAVSTALLLRVIIGAVTVRRLLNASLPLDSAEAAHLREVAGVRSLEVREGSLELPVTAGFVTPVVLLPKGWRDIPPGGLAVIIRHEAAHVRRRDCLTALLCGLVEALAWFNPAVWIATSRVRWFAEMACDSDASRQMDGEVYASELLTLAAAWADARRPRYTITAGAHSRIARRIRLLLDEVEQGGRPRQFLSLAAVVLLVTIPLAAKVRVGHADASTTAPAATWVSHADAHHRLHGH